MTKSIKYLTKAILLVLPLLFSNCNEKILHNSSMAKNNPRIIFEKTRCYGKCPIYIAKFYLNDKIEIYPEANFKITEKSLALMKKGRLKELLNEANEIDFWNLQDEYDNKNLQDAPETFITISNRGQLKKIRIRTQAPKKLQELVQSIEKEVTRAKWTIIK